MTPPASEALQEATALTLAYYNARADEFEAGTRDHDVRQSIAMLLCHVQAAAPLTILDFGCGPGRDLKVFAGLGHTAIGLDGAARFVDMARTNSGCTVWLQDFCQLDLPARHFDGVFANASLFHLPSQALPRLLAALHASLKPGGVLFSSNPHGHNEEGWSGGRYGAFYDLATWQRHLSDAGFVELTHYYRPEGAPRHQQPWLASVWRKPAD
ncbi:MAG: class I SAM-dependent methyltransferase [Polaromonas sp.]|nr:class I SAM-dependent methyltransferase [Polaromonas sp.]